MKKVLSILLAVVMLASIFTAMPIMANAEDKTVISVIEATSNADSVFGLGKTIARPEITVIVGSPAKFNGSTAGWEKLVDGRWQKCTLGETFEPGIYRIAANVGVYSSDYATHTLPEDTFSLTVDGASWSLQSTPVFQSTYCAAMVYSPRVYIHQYSVDWKFDETGHWHQCVDCEDIKDFAPHTPDHSGHATEEYAIKCTECGYEIEPKAGHVHTFDKEIVADQYKAADATCYSKALYYKSCACGQKGEETFETGDLLPHTEGTVWKNDGTNHWHECINVGCNATIETSVAAHVYDDEFDVSCNICNYKRTVVKPEITALVATSNIDEIAKAGKNVTAPSINITVGASIKYNVSVSHWQKKTGS